MTDDRIIERIKAQGIDAKRLRASLTDNWGGMVHAFEHLTVLGIVADAMRNAEILDVFDQALAGTLDQSRITNVRLKGERLAFDLDGEPVTWLVT